MKNCATHLIRFVEIAVVGFALSITEAKAFTTYHFGEISSISPPNHEEITRTSLLRIVAPNGFSLLDGTPATFTPAAIEFIIKKNVATDLETADIPQYHFDKEFFDVGQTNLVSIRKAIAKNAKAGDFNGARAGLGLALHAIQDFYSHSTWIETGKKTIAPLGVNDQLDFFASNLSSSAGCTKDGIIPSTSLTSDWFTIYQLSATNDWSTNTYEGTYNKWPANKCIHGAPTGGGAGLNQDSDARPLFATARNFAIKASVTYVDNVLADLGNDYVAMCGLFDQSRDQCRPYKPIKKGDQLYTIFPAYLPIPFVSSYGIYGSAASNDPALIDYLYYYYANNGPSAVVSYCVDDPRLQSNFGIPFYYSQCYVYPNDGKGGHFPNLSAGSAVTKVVGSVSLIDCPGPLTDGKSCISVPKKPVVPFPPLPIADFGD